MKMPHILIVDDEPNIVMSLEFLMRKKGYQVRLPGTAPKLWRPWITAL